MAGNNPEDVLQRKPKVPEGYANEAEFLSEMRTRFDEAIEADSDNRIAAMDDIRFTYGEQWDPAVLAKRKRARKPALTINRLPAYVAQVVNNRLLNETEIRIAPDRDGTKEIAEVRQGLIKAIFKNSHSDFARDEAMKYQVIAGQGAFQLCLDYNSDEVFYQDAKIEPIANPFAAVFDPLAIMPCAGDARWGWVVDDMDLRTFKVRYPWASTTGFGDGAATTGTPTTTWYSGTVIKIVSYWRMVEDGKRIIALTQAGSTVEVPKEQLQDVLAAPLMGPDGTPNPMAIMRKPDGTPMIREVPRKAAQKYLCSGGDILEGPYTLPVSSIPVYRVPGWELRTGEKTYRWGLVRFLKDPQRIHNYARSVLAQQMVAAPRDKWVATKEAISGYEKQWRNSHLDDDPVLVYNSEGQKPERIPPQSVDPTLIAEAQMTAQDIRDVSNIHEAALGQKSNEVSAKAIQARQQMTDLASFIYHDRLRLAEERCAKNLNELIPTVYDTMRQITILGEEDKALQAVINDPTQPDSNITLGKYSVTVTTGPATITKRALAAEQMMAFVNAAPETAQFVMDLVAESQDWPKAQEFARRFKMALPKGVVPPEDLPPEMQQAMQQQQDAEAEMAEMAKQRQQAEIQEIRATTAERLARARSLTLAGAKSVSDAGARAKDVDAKVDNMAFEQRLKTVEAAAKIQEDDSNDDRERKPAARKPRAKR